MSTLTDAIVQNKTNVALSIINGRNFQAIKDSASIFFSANALALKQHVKNYLGCYGDLHDPWNLKYGLSPKSYQNFYHMRHQTCPDDSNWDAYELAAIFGNIEVLQALYRNIIRYPRTSQWIRATELLLAIANKQSEMIKWLVESKNLMDGEWRVISNTYKNLSPMLVAVLPGYSLEIIKLLLQLGADPNQRTTFERWRDYDKGIALKINADGNIKSRPNLFKLDSSIKDATALFSAVFYNDDNASDLIECLVKNGADPDAACITDNETPISPKELARSQNKHKLLEAMDMNNAAALNSGNNERILNKRF